MSMNRTCPISNFTSEEDSVSRGFPSILSLLFQSNLFQNSREARLLPHAVVDLVNLKIPTSAVLLFVSFFQPIQTFFFLAKSKIDRRERGWTDVLPFRQLFEFVQGLLGFRSISGDRISVAEESLIPRTGIRSFGFLQFRDGAGCLAFFKEREADQNVADH